MISFRRPAAAPWMLGTAAGVGVLLWPDVAAAHGVGGRADLPLPVWLFAYGAAFALLISFVALRILWPRPRMAAAAEGRLAPPVLDRLGRAVRPVGTAVVAVVYAATMIAAVIGPDSVAANLAPTALYVAFWVGVPIASALFGDLWARANPLALIARALDRLAGRAASDGHEATGWWASHWPAALGLFSFLWLELAYDEPSSLLAVATFLGAYAAAVLVGAAVFGARWVTVGDGFAVMFSLMAALSPLYRDDADRLRLRWPGSGLAQVDVRPGTLAVLLVLLGGTGFDGVTRTQMWADVVGTRSDWALVAVNTAGLLATIAVVAAAFVLASLAVPHLAGDDDGGDAGNPDRWAPSLIPIVLAYAVAHYFSLLVFEGQSFLALLSDPWDAGWNLFGTAENRIDYTLVTATTIAYVQAAAIVVGHVAGVVTAHDRAVERYDHRRAARSQYPMLAVMVVYTVGGLLLLLNA